MMVKRLLLAVSALQLASTGKSIFRTILFENLDDFEDRKARVVKTARALRDRTGVGTAAVLPKKPFCRSGNGTCIKILGGAVLRCIIKIKTYY